MVLLVNRHRRKNVMLSSSAANTSSSTLVVANPMYDGHFFNSINNPHPHTVPEDSYAEPSQLENYADPANLEVNEKSGYADPHLDQVADLSEDTYA